MNAIGWSPVPGAYDAVPLTPEARKELWRTAEEKLAAAAAEVAEVAPDVVVTREVTSGTPAALLVICRRARSWP